MWKQQSSKVLFEHPRLVVEEDSVELPTGKTIDYLKYGYGGDGSVIIAVNNADEVLFIREYSYVPDMTLLQLPMGKIEDDETPEAAGNRELQEETGFLSESIALKGLYFQNHRRSKNRGYVLLATDLVASEHEMDEEEKAAGIEKVWVPRSEIKEMIKNGHIVDADTLSSLMIAGII